MHGYFHEDATLCSQVLCIIVLSVSIDFSVLTYFLIYILVLCRSTVWMMCVACCLSLTLMFQISFTASGSPSSSMLGIQAHLFKLIQISFLNELISFFQTKLSVVLDFFSES